MAIRITTKDSRLHSALRALAAWDLAHSESVGEYGIWHLARGIYARRRSDDEVPDYARGEHALARGLMARIRRTFEYEIVP